MSSVDVHILLGIDMAPNPSSQFETDSEDMEFPLEAEAEEAGEEDAASPAAPAGNTVPAASGAGSSAAARVSEGSIANHMVGDQPAGFATEDRLGFRPYVTAVAAFLTDPSTEVPLTLSVEGLWGTGKSSFMLQLQEALKKLGRTKIVSFNAWQYNADEGLWAAFIHEFDETMHRNLGFGERVRVRWRLFKLRLSWQDTIDTVKTVIWLIASLLVIGTLIGYLWQHGLEAFKDVLRAGKKPEEAATTVIGLVGGVGGTVAALMLFLTQIRELIKNPASLEKTGKMLARQKYDSQLPMIHRITHDFSELVTAYAGKEPVYVFIDDLDRCEHTRAADVMRALLMLVNKVPNVGLILGLDRDKVAAALATKQEALLPYLYKVERSELHEVGMDYGQRYLEKFIQVTYIMPRPSAEGLKAMINPEASPRSKPVSPNEKSVKAIRIVTGKDDSETLEQIVEMAGVVFDGNPRNVKQFVNMFRLQAFIANETGLFGSSRVMRDSGKALSIAQLAKFVALCMRWPELVQTASTDRRIVGTLETFFAVQQGKTPVPRTQNAPEEILPWGADRKLAELLGFGYPDEEFSLASVDFAALNEITPVRAGIREVPVEAEPAFVPSEVEAGTTGSSRPADRKRATPKATTSSATTRATPSSPPAPASSTKTFWKPSSTKTTTPAAARSTSSRGTSARQGSAVGAKKTMK